MSTLQTLPETFKGTFEGFTVYLPTDRKDFLTDVFEGIKADDIRNVLVHNATGFVVFLLNDERFFTHCEWHEYFSEKLQDCVNWLFPELKPELIPEPVEEIAYPQFVAALKNFAESAAKLNEAWDNFGSGTTREAYPFSTDFERVTRQIKYWVDLNIDIMDKG